MRAGELGFGVVDLRGREVEDGVGFKGADGGLYCGCVELGEGSSVVFWEEETVGEKRVDGAGES